MMEKNKVIIFDCDGTILDTFKLIEVATLKTFMIMFPDYPVTIEEVHAFFGPLIDESFAKYAKDQKEVAKCVETYRDIISKLQVHYVKSFPNINTMLKQLYEKKYKLAIVSNKVTRDVLLGLKINNIDQYFDIILGAEKLEKPKPSPEGIYQVLEYFNTDKGILVGDTIFDIECGQNAQKRYPDFKAIGVTWCKTSREEFANLKADYIVDDPLEIIKIGDVYYDV